MRTFAIPGPLLRLLLLAVLTWSGCRAQAVDNYFVFASGAVGTNNITCYSFNPTNAALTSPVTSAGGNGPGYLAWSPDRTHLYAINASITGATNGGVAAFSITASTGALTRLNDVASGTSASGPTHLCVHPNGKWVFVANYTSGHVASLAVLADGSMGAVIDTKLAGTNAHMVLTNAAGTRLYVPCLGANHVAVYDIDPATGLLTAKTPVAMATTGAGPRHMAFTSDETHAYVINELNSTMSRFVHNPTSGALTSEVAVTTLPATFTGTNTCAHVAVAKDNLTLYGSNRGHDSIVSFPITSSTGLLGVPNFVFGPDPDGAGPRVGEIQHPRDFTIDPTGKVLLVASRDSNLVSTFFITPTTGVLTYVGKVTLTNAPTFVGVMPKASVLTALAVTPATAALTTGGTRDFDAQKLDQFGAVMAGAPTVTWSVTGPGSINAAGLFTAAAAGSTTITVSDGTHTATATTTTTATSGGGSSGGGGGGGGGGGCGLGGGAAALALSLLLALKLVRFTTAQGRR